MNAVAGTAPVPAGIGAALDASRVAALLEAHAPARGMRVAECRVVRSRVRPGVRAIVQYAVRFVGAWPTEDLRVTVQWHAERARARRHERHALEAAARLASAWRSPWPAVMADAGAGLLLTTFPCDLRLPSLPAIVRGDAPALVGPMCARAGIAATDLTAVAVETVRYREQLNAVCRYTLTARQGGPAATFFVKAYGDDDTGALAAARLATLNRATRQQPHAAQVDAPVAYVSALRALVLAAAPGLPLDVAPAGDTPGRRENRLRLAAAALAAFGACAADPGVVRTRDDRLTATRRAAAAVAPALSTAAGLDGLVSVIEAQLGEGTGGLTHGDVKLEHVLVDGATVHLIDLDSCHLGDPRWDLALLDARWQAACRRMGDADAAARGWRAMRGAYFAGAAAPRAHGLQALRAAALLDAAAGAVKRHEPGAAPLATHLVTLAQRAVTET